MERASSARKRLRSDSLPSDASSPKRHTSVSPHSRPLDPNDEIDAYMAGQPDDSEGLPASASQSSDRVHLIEQLMCKTMEVGQTWYLIDRTWFKRWQKACKGEVDKEGPLSERDLGPVAVESLLDQYGNLKPGLVEGMDVEYVPEEAWNHFVTWYGKPHKSISRKAISRGQQQQVQLELHPPRFRVLKLTDGPAQRTDSPCHKYVTLSCRDTLKTLCQTVAKSVSPTSGYVIPCRVWVPDSNGTDFDFNYKEYPHTKIDPSLLAFVKPSEEIIDDTLYQSDDPFVVEFKGDNGWIIDINTQNEPAAPAPIFSSSEGFFNKMTPKTVARPTNALTTFGNKSTISSSTALGKSLNGSVGSVGRTIEPGTLGLGNMGNTCFMNSALQCLAHTKELTEYFRSGVYHDELNPDNPLGMQGAIAEAFGALLERIWASTGSSTSYSPREFKSQLQRFAPQFSGYQQHDSQELVAFLLDGLHEDLNRVLKKPYVEKPDWEGGDDKELMKLAKASWDGYKLRNDSVIVDLFQGQYQSTLVCPECQKVSITFDPFMYLTLPLPIQKKWRHTIFYVPWDSTKPHVKVPIEINRDSTFKDVRALLARWMSPFPPETDPTSEPINPDNLLTLEIFSNRFYKNLDDTVLVSDMTANDTIVCFELPCHAQQARSYRERDKEEKKSDPLILPLFLCDALSERSGRMGGGYSGYNYRSGNVSLFGYPSIVVVSREQAKSEDGIAEAVVDRLQRWTGNARDLWTWEERDGSVQSTISSEEDIVKIDLRSGDVGSTTTSVTEVRENGDVVEMQPEDGDEGDIVDEKFTLINGTLEDDLPSSPRNTVRVGVKKNIFALKLQKNHQDYGTNQGYSSAANKYESWERRQQAMDEGEEDTLLLPGDALFCEWDVNMKAYYFGEEKVFEHAQWEEWEEFTHPEYQDAQRKAGDKKMRGISLQDCLDEFTKEEKLGEDDLWYCPRCKKHQQATKRFDLWKVPDVLVVHLKRFSNSRMLRDKIDAFVDFPIDGLDLTDMAGERPVAKRLKESGLSTEELGEVMDTLNDGLDEPLVYDLFAVDEHIGGLGGGHYRAYALNHMNSRWYHFDDSYVTTAKATEAVNANAYLLFYRRRTSKPLGGRSHELTEQAKLKPKSERTLADAPSLPTPPLEPAYAPLPDYFGGPSVSDLWTSGTSTLAPLPSPSLDADPPTFEDSRTDGLLDGNDIAIDEQDVSHQYRFDQRSSSQSKDGAASPVSSTGAEPDVDSDAGDWTRSQNFGSPPAWSDSVNSNSAVASPSTSSPSGSPKPALKGVPMDDVVVTPARKQDDGLGLSL
ncbi:cysteine proteinase [Marasmius fiardii PR-910]|nr:cysteine proteinase [Marasmius fiardii PR-910]